MTRDEQAALRATAMKALLDLQDSLCGEVGAACKADDMDEMRVREERGYSLAKAIDYVSRIDLRTWHEQVAESQARG